MKLAISTNWNSRKFPDGHRIVDAVHGVGLDAVEFGYSLRRGQAEDIAKHVEAGEITVTSVHAFCPVPMGTDTGSPELFSICSLDPRGRRKAIAAVVDTARTAASVGAKVVVLHAGRVPMRWRTARLHRAANVERADPRKLMRRLMAAQDARDRRVEPFLDALYASLDELAAKMEELGVVLALENLPSIDAIPSESEMFDILEEYSDCGNIAYWHDIGHGQVRQGLGIINHLGVLKRLLPSTAGMHVHDVRAPLEDHTMPPRGGMVNFRKVFELVGDRDIPAVLEPAEDTPAEFVQEAVDFIGGLLA